MNSIEREKRILAFRKLQRKIRKLFPDAKTEMVGDSYYVSNGHGRRLIPEYLMIPNSKSVYDAWIHAEKGMWYHKLLERNKRKFSDEKVMKKRL